jgi:hypothetical protein
MCLDKMTHLPPPTHFVMAHLLAPLPARDIWVQVCVMCDARIIVAGSLAVHCSCFDAGDARIFNLPFLFALDYLPLYFCRDGLGTPCGICGGYARRRQGGTENHSRITKKRPANHCFDAVRVLQCLQTWNCCCIGSFTYHDFPERSDVRVSIDCSYLIFHQISAARKRKCREMEGNSRRLESGKLFATALSPQQRRRKALQIADRLHGHAQSRNRTRAIYFLSNFFTCCSVSC